MDSNELGMYIRTKRMEKGMKQQELADCLRVSRATVSKWETGSNSPDVTTFVEISQILDFPPAELLQIEKMPDTEETGVVSGPDSDVPAQSEAAPLISESPVKRKNNRRKIAFAFGVETVVLIASLIFNIVQYSNRPPVFTILDNFHDTYEGRPSCCFIVVCEGRFTQDAWTDYVDTFRERYILCFDEVESIVVACFNEYNEEIDTIDSADYITILYDYPLE